MKRRGIVIFSKKIDGPVGKAVLGGLSGVFGALVAGAVLLVVGLSLALVGAIILGGLALGAVGAPLAAAATRRGRRRRADLPAGDHPGIDREGRPLKHVEARVKHEADQDADSA